MTDVFIKIVNMSVSASYAVVAVLLLRLILKKAPKKITCALWGLVGLRLVLPFSIESVFSLIPKQTAVIEITPSGNVITSEFITATGNTPTAIETQTNITDVLCAIWLAGIVCLIVYSIASYVKLRLKVKDAANFRGNIRTCDLPSPFVLGIIRPQIYLPNGISKKDTEFVIAHEEAHIKRKDQLLKPLAFAILSLHWFNPLVWLGYVLFCRDIELACDEKTVANFSREERADYSEALLKLSTRRLSVAACPLAFGEVGVKTRIKSVLNYKKPTFWLIAVAIAVAIVAGICFLTDPKPDISQKYGSELEGLSLEIVKIETSAPDPYVTVKIKNNSSADIFCDDSFRIYHETDGTWEDCRINEDVPQIAETQAVSSGNTKNVTYRLNGLIMTQPGTYRFETEVISRNEKHTVYIEFVLKTGVDGVGVLTFKVTEIPYNDPLSSYFETVNTAPTFRLVNGTVLQIVTDTVTTVGELKKTELTEENFDSLFLLSSFEKIRTENKNVWSGSSDIVSYLLLEQKNGDFYLAEAAPDRMCRLYKLKTA